MVDVISITDQMMIETLDDFVASWCDKQAVHVALRDDFDLSVNQDPELKAHRDYIEAGAWGFGERSFHWLWKLIVDTMPTNFTFLEIGVHRGQVPSLIALLALRTNRKANIIGVSPYSGKDTGPERDYRIDVTQLHEHFKQPVPTMVVGDSVALQIVEITRELGPFNIVYIDGSHATTDVTSDILNYAPMLVPDGILVMDDSANRFDLPWGMFAGHQSVSVAVDSLLPPFGCMFGWQHLGNIVHNRIWRRSTGSKDS